MYFTVWFTVPRAEDECGNKLFVYIVPPKHNPSTSLCCHQLKVIEPEAGDYEERSSQLGQC